MAEHCSLFQITSFSAIVPILESLTNLLHCCVDNLEPFRAAGDQRVKPFALLHALADPLILLARRGTVLVNGSARNQGRDLVQVAPIDRAVEPELDTAVETASVCSGVSLSG